MSLPRHIATIVLTLTWLALPIASQAALPPAESSPPIERSPAATEQGTALATLSIKVGDEIIPYPVFAIYLMPGERRSIEPVLETQTSRFEVAAAGGTLESVDSQLLGDGEQAWLWTAPDTPGVYPLTVRRSDDSVMMTVHAFVMTPASDVINGRLNCYRLGGYPQHALRGQAIYDPPEGFVEVTDANRDTRISPHFTLGEFVAKQRSDYPKYVALRERLLLKLEMIVEQLAEAGYQASGLHIMSGFRTPWYNASIGNVPYSRHVWGGAADIFVDEAPKDGVMDDLNGDGRIDAADARVIYNLIETLSQERWYQPFVGGMGLYGPKPGVRGPFVHVDVRGFRARW